MEMSEELKKRNLAEKKSAPNLKGLLEVFPKIETGVHKTGNDKSLPSLPAPFYDELHFADYE